MRNEDDHSEKVIDNEQKDNLDIIKQDDHKDDGDKGDDHAGVKEPEAPPVLPERVDIVLAQDLSQSLGDDLSNLQDPFLTNLDANLAAGGATDAAYGIISFIDYPIPEEGCGLATDRIYNTNQAVTEDVATAQAGLAGLAIRGGLDAPEAQLVALQQVALQAEDQIGFRPDAERFVVLSTTILSIKLGITSRVAPTTTTPIWPMALVRAV